MSRPARLDAFTSLAISTLLHLALVAWVAPSIESFSCGPTWTQTIDARLVAFPVTRGAQNAPEPATEPAEAIREPSAVAALPDSSAPPSTHPAPSSLEPRAETAQSAPPVAPRSDPPSANKHARPSRNASPRRRDASPGTATAAAEPTVPNSASGGDARSRAEQRFLAELREAIAASRYYPPSAQARHIEGRVTLAFVLAMDGALSQVEVRGSSGYAILDQAALETLHRLGRFKPIPPELRRESWPIRVPIEFALREPGSSAR